jgi:hypothetical protein
MASSSEPRTRERGRVGRLESKPSVKLKSDELKIILREEALFISGMLIWVLEHERAGRGTRWCRSRSGHSLVQKQVGALAGAEEVICTGQLLAEGTSASPAGSGGCRQSIALRLNERSRCHYVAARDLL